MNSRPFQKDSIEMGYLEEHSGQRVKTSVSIEIRKWTKLDLFFLNTSY
jgi:hypothetical protein